MFLYPRHSSCRIRPPEPPEGHCIICTIETGLYCAVCTISNFSGNFHFLQIRLDGSNYHISPPCFTQMKWKIEGSSGHKHERTLQFFTFSPAIYSTYNGSARKKSRRIFSCARVRIRLNEFSPGNICLYTIAATMRGSGQAWRLESAVDIYYLGRT